MKELLEILAVREVRPDLPYALATVVKVRGSSYRKPGARMLIGARGRLAGSVSGGCLEKDVMSRGLAVILSGETQLAVYDTTDQDDLAFGASLGCEGRIEILIEPVPANHPWPLAEMAALVRKRRRPAGLALVYQTEGEKIPSCGALQLRLGDENHGWPPDAPFPTTLEGDLAQVVATKKSLSPSYSFPGGRIDVLLERIAPPMPLVILGGATTCPPWFGWRRNWATRSW